MIGPSMDADWQFGPATRVIPFWSRGLLRMKECMIGALGVKLGSSSAASCLVPNNPVYQGPMECVVGIRRLKKRKPSAHTTQSG